MPEVNEKRLKIREGEFRSYVVSAREVLNGAKGLLTAAGYTLLPNDPAGLVTPSFRARREWPGGHNEIFAIVRPSLKKAVDGLVYLTVAHSVLGDKAEYALLLPPINEYVLIEFLEENDHYVQREMDRRKFMLWMYNPAEEAILTFVGSSIDPVFRQSIMLPGLLSMKVVRRMKELEAKRQAASPPRSPRPQPKS